MRVVIQRLIRLLVQILLEDQIDFSGNVHDRIWRTPLKTFGGHWTTGVLHRWSPETLNCPDQLSSLVRTLEGHQWTHFPVVLMRPHDQGLFWVYKALSGLLCRNLADAMYLITTSQKKK